MITRRTKIQLLIFVIITLLGVSYVGARYAKLDRLVLDESYTVTAHYGDDSGGIFTGAEVTYRGVDIGKVSDMVLTRDGVDVKLDIDNKWSKIPADTVAVVGNRSAIGEQYVELQPSTDDGPYLEDGSQISRTEVPIATQKLLGDVVDTVDSVNKKSLSTTISELGKAFDQTGPDLQRIIDTSTSFIKTADANFEVTRDLIRDSSTVLNTQALTDSALRQFASGLSAFTTTLAGDDKSLRKVIRTGSYTASQLRTLLQQNHVHLASLLQNVVTTDRIVVQHLPGLRVLLVALPLLISASNTVVDKTPSSDKYDAHFGLVLVPEKPLGKDFKLCRNGYQGTKHRSPSNGQNWAMNTNARCSEPITESNVRGEQNLRRIAPFLTPSVLNSGRPSTIASYDERTGKITWSAPQADLGSTGSVAPQSLGRNSWTWLYLQPLLARQ